MGDMPPVARRERILSHGGLFWRGRILFDLAEQGTIIEVAVKLQDETTVSPWHQVAKRTEEPNDPASYAVHFRER